MEPNKDAKILVLAGPGNNGGDGLVACRHLAIYGYKNITLHYPKPSQRHPMPTLVEQLNSCCQIRPSPLDTNCQYDSIIDAIFGFSFSGTSIREPFTSPIELLQTASSNRKCKILAVDVPSGWPVDLEDINSSEKELWQPHSLISLSAPKPCSVAFNGDHYRNYYLIVRDLFTGKNFSKKGQYLNFIINNIITLIVKIIALVKSRFCDSTFMGIYSGINFSVIIFLLELKVCFSINSGFSKSNSTISVFEETILKVNGSMVVESVVILMGSTVLVKSSRILETVVGFVVGMIFLIKSGLNLGFLY